MLHLPLSFPGWEGDLFSDFMTMPGYGSCRGSACAAPHLYRPAAAAPTFRVLRAAPAFPEPEEPEVYISRSEEGVLAACPLGRAFSRDDISLDLEGRDLTITAWHPQTRHWRAYGRERPAAYQRTLELAPHLDAQRMRARLDTATGTLELFFPYRRVAPAPQPRPRVVVVQSTMAVPVPPAAPAPRPSLVRASAPAPAPRVPSSPTQPAAAPAPAVTPAAAPVPAAEMEADDASAMAQRAHRRRQRHHHAQRRRSSSPKQAEQACPTCCCQAASPAPAPPAGQQQQPKAQPRVIPIECGEPSSSAAAAEPQRKAAQRSRPSSPAAAPLESPRSAAASPAASPSTAAKGKGPASPEQVAKWQRQQRAAAAAKRIAAGVASDSDWEDADGSVSECGLDD